jgi:hypothetical protein
MVFQPVGYPFEISSALSPPGLKRSIRSRTKGWFDMKDGARGWVVGPIVCLWFSAFDRHGPMLLGWISRNTRGTRIVGRAGSDLNGVLLLVALTPFIVFYLSMMPFTGGVAFFAASWVLICGIVLWAKHVFRRDAEPLVRFLKEVAKKSDPSRRAQPAAAADFSGLVLTVNGDDQAGGVTPDTIHEALLGIGVDGFAVLATAPEIYVQTAWHDGGFIIEKRDGDEGRHFRAARSGRPAGPKDRSRLTFTFEEVLAVFLAYASGTPMPASVAWETMR